MINVPISLRTHENELHYQKCKMSGDTEDIAKLSPKTVISNTNMIENQFEYDLAHKDGHMSVANQNEEFMEWWVNVGLGILKGKFADFDQFIFNLPRRQSQPHVPHGHFVNLDEEQIEVLRTLLTEWRKGQ